MKSDAQDSLIEDSLNTKAQTLATIETNKQLNGESPFNKFDLSLPFLTPSTAVKLRDVESFRQTHLTKRGCHKLLF